MRLAQRSAIYRGMPMFATCCDTMMTGVPTETRGQGSKEVDQKRYRPKCVDKNIRQRKQNPRRRCPARG
jgi:hypothetical protein